jgi:hypothetical protein
LGTKFFSYAKFCQSEKIKKEFFYNIPFWGKNHQSLNKNIEVFWPNLNFEFFLIAFFEKIKKYMNRF